MTPAEHDVVQQWDTKKGFIQGHACKLSLLCVEVRAPIKTKQQHHPSNTSLKFLSMETRLDWFLKAGDAASPSVKNTFLFWLHTITSAVNFPQFLCLSVSPSLSFSLSHSPVLCDWSVFCHRALRSYKTTAGGGDTHSLVSYPGERCRINSHTLLLPSPHSQQHYCLWIFKAASCVKDLQHFQRRAWKGKTGG